MCVRGLLASLASSFLHITTGWCVTVQVSVITHLGVPQGRTEKAVAKMNNTFWELKGASTSPDLLCGRSADYTFVQGYFAMLVCFITVLGGK